MGTIYIGSARSDERGKLSGGKVSDQKQTSSTNDVKGEVSMQSFYVHSKGWLIFRPKDVSVANKIAKAMTIACNNPNLGYDQSNRLGVIKYGINTIVKTECDCSALVRACIINATGKDVGNFNTSNETSALDNSGLFEKRIVYVNQIKTPVYNGDILVTKTKGHTAIVVSGNPRQNTSTINNSGNESNEKYSQIQFIKDIQQAIGAKVDGKVGNETLSKLPTVSCKKNNRHAVVKPLQKYLNAIGYSCGNPDGIAGQKFDNATKMWAKANGCAVDGEFTKGGKSWKRILGVL